MQSTDSLRTITAWCAWRGISRTSFYKMKKLGKAPRTIELTPGDHRVTPESDREWIETREAEAKAKAEAA